MKFQTAREIEKATRFVNAHPPAKGYSIFSADAVWIRLECFQKDTQAVTHKWHDCRSFSEVRAALGY